MASGKARLAAANGSTIPKLDPSIPRIIIIGAGFGGLGFAIALQRRLGWGNYLILEKATDVGGTWHQNTYPGCSSDVDIYFYQLSTDPKTDWSSSHPPQPEVLAYLSQLAAKHGIYERTAFQQEVVAAEWDEGRQLWSVRVKDGRGTEPPPEITLEAEILISAVGILEQGHYPDIPGIKDFRGETFHSSAWNSDVDLKGKRVGVIGCGASAAQFVPLISEDSSVHVTNFCRTPNWFVPNRKHPISNFTQLLCKYLPGYRLLLRFLTFLTGEFFYFAVFSGPTLRPLMKKFLGWYLKRTAPTELHDKLIPSYEPGCKRIIFDPGYLSSLHRRNVTLCFDPISRITEKGLVAVTHDGGGVSKGTHHDLDVLIYATGFTADEYPIPIRGREKQPNQPDPLSIQEYYALNKGPKGYLGVATPGFPNFFTIMGPNTTTGHTSVLFFQEVQFRYILDLIVPSILEPSRWGKKEGVRSIEVSHEATDKYNERIHKKLGKSVHMGCTSWYRRDGEGKISSIYPGSATHYWLELWSVNWDHYVGFPEESWSDALARQREQRIWKWSVLTLLVLTPAMSAFLYNIL